MKITFSTTEEFIPEWNGNKDAPADERIVFHWRKPTNEDRDQIRILTPLKFTASGQIIDEMAFDYDKVKLIKSCVTKIDNLEVNGKKIETGRAFALVSGLGELFDEVCMYLTPRLEINAETKKK